jgi:hypothetical protein
MLAPLFVVVDDDSLSRFDVHGVNHRGGRRQGAVPEALADDVE